MRIEDAETLADVQRRSYAVAGTPVVTTWPQESALDAVGLKSFLDSVRYGVLATAGPGGCPQAAPVGFLVDQGSFWIATVPGARLRNVRTLPCVSLVVMEGVTVHDAESRPHTALRADGSVIVHENPALDDVRERLSPHWRERYDDALDWAAAVIELAPDRLFSFSSHS